MYAVCICLRKVLGWGRGYENMEEMREEFYFLFFWYEFFLVKNLFCFEFCVMKNIYY